MNTDLLVCSWIWTW